ncbi:MAG: hypothetical protein VM34scaffold347_17 [Phage 66_12]|jgi:hypothetical protein|nr:MAG: hypothetical protein VM34scaffold347_17 [Phage 66_12]
MEFTEWLAPKLSDVDEARKAVDAARWVFINAEGSRLPETLALVAARADLVAALRAEEDEQGILPAIAYQDATGKLVQIPTRLAA